MTLLSLSLPVHFKVQFQEIISSKLRKYYLYSTWRYLLKLATNFACLHLGQSIQINQLELHCGNLSSGFYQLCSRKLPNINEANLTLLVILALVVGNDQFDFKSLLLIL